MGRGRVSVLCESGDGLLVAVSNEPVRLCSGLGQVTSWASILGLGLHQARGLKLVALGLSVAYRHVSFGARILGCFVIKFESLCTGLAPHLR